MNRLIVIGFRSDKKAYLNVPREEAIRRYLLEHPEDETDVRSGLIVDVIDFEDEFYVYDAWGA
jgi:hypothetical protein